MRIRETSVAIGLILVALACAKPGLKPTVSTTKVDTAVAPVPARSDLPKELVVGTSGGSPPFVTRRAGTTSGLELDLAAEVGKIIGVPVRVVDLPWDQLFDALRDDRVDVVMAGVTITPERKAQYAFAEPYLRTGIAALVRTSDREKLGSRDAACKSRIDVGVVNKTTGHEYVREKCPAVTLRVFETADDAVLELANGKIDAVIGDAPVLAFLSAQQAVSLDLVPTGKVDEQLAWMVRKDETALKQALDSALATMSKNGTLDRILQKWIPQVDRVRQQ
jgi:ABC-type amino acid transport substrate-binding protein